MGVVPAPAAGLSGAGENPVKAVCDRRATASFTPHVLLSCTGSRGRGYDLGIDTGASPYTSARHPASIPAFALWAGKVTDLHVGAQVIYIVMAGAGMGLMLGQANTDAINRASRYSYGEATGITQTVRNYGASLGFAILGTILITEFRTKITSSLIARGLPQGAASAEAAKIAQLQGGNGNITAIPAFIRADFAAATRDVLYGMTIVMAVAAVVALRGLRHGVQQEPEQADARVGAALPREDPGADLGPSWR